MASLAWDAAPRSRVRDAGLGPLDGSGHATPFYVLVIRRFKSYSNAGGKGGRRITTCRQALGWMYDAEIQRRNTVSR